MKCYIWWSEWNYSISRNEKPWYTEYECKQEDIEQFSKIAHWAIEEIQYQIREILYAKQLILWLQKKK